MGEVMLPGRLLDDPAMMIDGSSMMNDGEIFGRESRKAGELQETDRGCGIGGS
jgi:hypothetical protein